LDKHITIPKLAPFLQDFSEEHRAQPMTLEVLVGNTWDVQESGLPLVGLDLDTRGADAPSVEIILGDQASGETGHLTHTVRRVKGVIVEVNDKEVERRVIIEGEDGSRAVLSIG